MKQLTCEMCGSTDMVKQDGMFVCQSCGTKYSVEEAKKMMVEGTVSVEGVVKTENADFEIRAGELIAYHGKDTEIVIPDGVKIIGENCFKSMQGIESVTIPESVYKIGGAAFSSCSGLKKVTLPTGLRQMGYRVFWGCNSLQSLNIPESVTVIENCAFGNMPALTDVHLPASFKIEDAKRLASDYVYDCSDADDEHYISYGTIASPWFIKEYDKYKSEEAKKASKAAYEAQQKKSGCYIATAVYGSYDCPQVWTLRRYRDNQLAKTRCGRAFIHTYYAVSPTLVNWFGDAKWFRKLWKGKLDRIVKNLNAQGVENTPYQDRNW